MDIGILAQQLYSIFTDHFANRLPQIFPLFTELFSFIFCYFSSNSTLCVSFLYGTRKKRENHSLKHLVVFFIIFCANSGTPLCNCYVALFCEMLHIFMQESFFWILLSEKSENHKRGWQGQEVAEGSPLPPFDLKATHQSECKFLHWVSSTNQHIEVTREILTEPQEKGEKEKKRGNSKEIFSSYHLLLSVM